MSSATVTRTPTTPVTAAKARRRPLTVGRVVLYVFVTLTALAWLFPVVWALLNSFRDYNYTSLHGYVSLGGFTIQNYIHAWEQGEFTRHFLNSLIITVPAVLLTLFLASCVAFVVARYSFRFNLILLGLFTAANLLPQQALLIPLFRAYRSIPLPLWMSDSGQLLDSYWGLILVVTVIESLRAFDIVWVINKGTNGLELISTLVTSNVVGEASRIGFGSALATIMLAISLVFITIFLSTVMRGEQR